MCGIYGIVGNLDKIIVQHLQHDMLQRGPDSQGIYADDVARIGMNRLHLRGDKNSITPFHIGDNVFCYNGEVYGKVNRDLTFLDNTNGGVGEVQFILDHDNHGELDGMYAFARYDTIHKLLELKRDRFGIKPLFYSVRGEALIFSSCIRSLLKYLPEYRPVLQPNAVFDIYTYGYSLNCSTAFEGINELLPNTAVNYVNNNLVVSRELNYPKDVQDVTKANLRTYLQQSIANCLKGNYKIGLAISGGVDSTILAHELNKMNVEDVETFSVILKEAGDGVKSLKEIGFQGKGAWNSWNHNFVEISIENFKTYMTESIDQFCYPTDMHSLPLFTALSKKVAERGIRVLLTGEGADELFMGYPKFLTYNGKETVSDYYLSGNKGKYIKKIFDPEIVESGIHHGNTYSQGDFWSQVRQVELKCRLQKLLLRTDVILMENNIEGRTPFLHSGIPDIALRHSAAASRGPIGKKMLREAYIKEIRGIVTMPKKRFKASEQLFIDVFNDSKIKDVMYQPIASGALNISSDLVDTIYKSYETGDQSDLSELLFLIYTTKKCLVR